MTFENKFFDNNSFFLVFEIHLKKEKNYHFSFN